MTSNFRIEYEPSRFPVEEPERFDSYDAESALYDFVRAGAAATVIVGETRLGMGGVNFVDLIQSVLDIAEAITAGDPGMSVAEFRPDLAEVPDHARIHSWFVADYGVWIPLIIFASDGATVWIYTRTYAEPDPHPLIVWPERDRVEPAIETRNALIHEIHRFLTRAFDDLVAAYPFLADDELYATYRRRIAALA